MVGASLFIVKAYRFFFSPDHGIVFQKRVRTCRFYPSCSEYALDALTKYGFLKGWWFSCKRLGRCHPWSKADLYDPIQ